MGEDGEVVRRRTIITLGPRTGSSGSINVTLLSSGSQTDLLRSAGQEQPNSEERRRPSSLGRIPPTKLFLAEMETGLRGDRQKDGDTGANEGEDDKGAPLPAAATSVRSGTVSAFNARRTIEQRRQHQAQQQHVNLFDLYCFIQHFLFLQRKSRFH